MLKLFSENKKFRNYLMFTVFNSVGGGIFAIFMIWVIHSQYQNPFYTGLAGFMFAVMTITNFIVGPFVDRRNKANLLRTTCFVSFIVVSLILAASLTYMPGVWFLLAMILIKAAAGLISRPAGTALMPRIVGSEDLIKANALMSIVSIFVGLGIGAFLYVAMVRGADFTLVFAVNAAVLLIALAFSFFIDSAESIKSESKSTAPLKAYFSELKEGFAFVKGGVIMLLALAVLAQDIAASVAYVNVPMLAQIHTGEASAYIILTALAMIGGLLGAYMSRIFGPKLDIWKILAVCFIFAGLARILFVNVIPDNFTRALLIHAFYIGMGSTTGIFFDTLIQKLPPKHLVARVSAIIVSLVGVTSAFGALLGGIIGTVVPDIDMIFIAQGSTYMIIGLFVSMSKRIRDLPKINDVTTFESEEKT